MDLDGVLAEQHLLEEAETEQHEFGVVGEQFFISSVGCRGAAFADQEFSETFGVVTDHEEQLQAALGRLADAGARDAGKFGAEKGL